MADAKITALTPWTTPIDTDVLPIVDVTAGVTKKITKANMFTNVGLEKFNLNPTVGAHIEGKLYYDALWKCLSVDLDTDVTMQIGEETLAYCKNVTGSVIPNGSVVYVTGADGGYPTIDLADASDINKSFVLGIVTKSAGIAATTGMGHVTIRGNVNDLNTDTWNAGTVLYLSGTVPGTLTATAPSAGKYDVRVCRVLIKHASTGRVFVNLRPMMNLTDLGDVTVTTPLVDEVLGFNGTEWINKSGVTVSSSLNINFFNDDASILAIENNNSNHVETLLNIPRTAAQQAEVVESVTTTVTPKVMEGYLYNVDLGRVKLDAGIWEFNTYCSASGAPNSPQIDRTVYRVISGTGTLSTVRTAGSAVATQTATTGLFAAGDATADITTCGYLQTPQGVYEITGFTDTKTVTITVPNGGTPYADETDIPAGSWRVWKKLFGINTGNITFTNLNYGLIISKSFQPEITLTADGSDRLGTFVFARSTSVTRIINFVHNGEVRASHLSTPLVTLHDDLAGLEGGSSTERYHMTLAQNTKITTSNTLHSVLLGNTTSAPEEVVPGSSGNVLTSDGTTWTSAAATGGGGDILSMQVFT